MKRRIRHIVGICIFRYGVNIIGLPEVLKHTVSLTVERVGLISKSKEKWWSKFL